MLATLSVFVFLVVSVSSLLAVYTYTRPASRVQAATSSNLNFQARIANANGSSVPDGLYNIQFKLYDGGTQGGAAGTGQANSGTGGTHLWTESYFDSNGVTAGNDNRARVVNGYVSVNLGSQTAFPGTINWDQELWLTMNIGGVTQTATPTYDGEMVQPTTNYRTKLTAVPYAFAAEQLAKTSGANRGTLSFGTVANNPVITLPDATGTVCLQGSTACNFAAGSGDADYIQNGTTLQTSANFNIQAANNGVNGTIGGIIRGAANGQTFDLFQLQNPAGGVVARFLQDGQLLAPEVATNVLKESANTGSYISLNAASSFFGAVKIDTRSTGNIGVIIKGTSGQTADLLQVHNATGTLLSGVDAAGNFYLAAGQSLKVTGSTAFPASPTEGQVYYRTDTKQLYVYANGKWQADRSTATVIVGTSASGGASGAVASKLADGADFVNTSDTSAQTIINAAIATLPASGGSVYLMEGTYIVDGSINLPNNTTLVGAGASTIIKVKNSHNAAINVITNSDTATGTKVTIQDLRIDGNKANQTAGTQYGIYMLNMGSGSAGTAIEGVRINNIGVRSMRDVGIFLNITSNSYISNSSIVATSSYGLYMVGASNYNTITSNLIQGNTGGGIYYETGVGSTFSGNTVQGNTSYGIQLSSTSGNTVTGNTFANNVTRGIYLFAANNNSVTGNTITSNAAGGIQLSSASSTNTISGNKIHDNGGAGSNEGIVLTDGDSNIFVGNDITDTSCTTSCRAVYVQDASSASNYFADNRFSDTDATIVSSFSDAGTSTIYANQSRAVDGGQLTVRTANDTTSFQIQNSAGAAFLTTDTSSNNRVQIGSSTTDATAILTVFDSFNNGTDPTGVNGAVYYNTSTNKFRCFQSGAWTDCIAAGGAGSGVTTVGTFSASSQTNGATISGTTITFGPADATNPGMVSTGSQTFAGAKTFNGAVTLAAAGTGLSVTNDATIGGTLGVTGLTTLGGGLTATGTTLINTTGSAATTIGNTNSALNIIGNGATAATNVVSLRVAADTNDRFTIGADGKLSFGTGAAATDVTLARSGTNTLNVAGALVTNSYLQGGSGTGATATLRVYASTAGTTATSVRGAASQTADLLQLQDSAGAVLSGYSAAGSLYFSNSTFTSTINSTTLTANRTINLPNESGTICLQSSTSCGFAAASGSGNYIQNGTTLQTANFNIQSVAAGSVGAIVQAAAGQTADTFQAIGTSGTLAVNNTGRTITFGFNGSNSIVTSGASSTLSLGPATASNSVYIASNGFVGITNNAPSARLHITGSVTSGGSTTGRFLAVASSSLNDPAAASSTIPTAAFSSFGQSTLSATNAISTTNTSTLYIQAPPIASTNQAITNTYGLQIDTASVAGAGTVTNAYGLGVTAPTGATNNYAATFLGGNVGIGTASPLARLDVRTGSDGTIGQVIRANSVTQTASLLQIQDSSSNVLSGFNPAGNLFFNNSSFTNTLSTATLTAARNISLPDASGTVCLQASTSCGFVTGSGAAFVNGGNSFGGAATLGTNDNNDLGLKTNNTTKLTLTAAGNLQFAQGANRTLNVATNTTTNGAGYNFSLQAGAADGTTTGAAGGVLALLGGAAAGIGNNNGGNIALDGGTATGSGTRGSVVLQGTSGNVGIGVAAPTYKLEINGALRLQPSAAPTAARGVTYFDSTTNKFKCSEDGTTFVDCIASGAAGLTGTGTTNYLSKYTGTNTLAISQLFDNGTNVGIGTTSPSAFLTVTQAQPATTGAAGTNAATALQVTGGTGGNTTGIAATAGNGAPISLTAGTGGTATSGVSGTGGNGGNITLQSGGAGTGTSANGTVGNILFNPGVGNVGIGNSAPTYKLDVTGALRLQPSAAPAAARGVTYFDSTANKFKCSENGTSFVDCISAGDGGVTTIGAIDSQAKSANGAVISGTTLYLQNAEATFPGLVSTGSQTLAGTKTFTSDLTVTNANGGSVIVAGSDGGIELISGNDAFTVIDFKSSTNAGTDYQGRILYGDSTGFEFRVGASTNSALSIGNSNGAATFKNNTNSTAAFQIQNAAGTAFFTADTSANNRVQFGSSTTDATAILTVFDSYNNGTDPTGVNGATYYNTSTNKFRCFQNSAWTDCIGAGGGSGVTTVGTFSASSQTNGANITGTTITFGPADTTNPGMVSAGSQTFAGAKTLNGVITAASAGTALVVTNSASIGNTLTLGTASTTNGTLVFNNSTNANTISIASGATSTTYSLVLPTALGSNGQCLEIATGTALTFGNCGGGAGSQNANRSLSNLNSTAINQNLLPGTAGAISLGSSSFPFSTLSLAGTSGTPGTNNFSITGAATAARTITLPDQTGTVCVFVGASTNCPAGAGSGVTTVGTFSGSSQTNGATISGTTITFGPADTTNPGMVSTGSQTFGGAKTFNNTLTVSAGGAAITGNASFTLGNASAATFTSDLSTANRSTSAVTITQANNATFSNSSNLLNLLNQDTDSAGPILSINQSGTGSGISLSGLGNSNRISIDGNNLTTGHAITIDGTNGNTTATISGNFINFVGGRSYIGTATRSDSSSYIRGNRTNVVNGTGATYNVTGDVANLSSNCTQTVGTCTDDSNILELSQLFATASGAVLNVSGAGTGNQAIFDASNATANGVSIDVQSSASGQYAFRTTSNNGATNGLYVRADGNVAIGNAAPGYKLDVSGALRLQPSAAPTAATGVMYFDSTASKFKCSENGSTFVDCIGAGGATPTLQQAYDASATPATVATTSTTKNIIFKSGTGFDSTAIFQIQDAAGTGNILIADTTNKVLKVGTTAAATVSGAKLLTTVAEVTTTLQVGDGTNGVVLSATSAPLYRGSARPSKRIFLTAEYAGAVLDKTALAGGVGDTNTGTMTSSVDYTNRMNYYKWTTTSVANQTYDVVMQVPIPQDFSAFAATNPIRISTYTSSTTNGLVTFELRDSSNTVIHNFVSVTPTANNTWQTKDPGTVTGTYTAGDYLTIRVRMQSPTNGDIRIGNIYLDYLSKF